MVTIFDCGRENEQCDCGRTAVSVCEFPLKGRMAGKVCGKALCERCTRPNTRCRAHHDYENREKTNGSE